MTLSAESLSEIIGLHDETGHVDYVTVGYGSYLEFDGIIPSFTHGEKLSTPLTAQLKVVVKHAAITSEAGVRTPENAETIVASGEADLVSIVRGQILDLLQWYKRKFGTQNGILRCNTFLEDDDIRRHAADTVILATGSLPEGTGFQRWLPDVLRLQGIDRGNVWSPEEVLRREARMGDAVVVYVEGGNWRGVGTAWALAKQGKQVTIITPDPFVGKELACTAADGTARQRLARLGAKTYCGHLITAWHGNGVTKRNMLAGDDATLPASALVMATTHCSFDPFSESFAAKTTFRIGDCTVPWLAAYAFHEGRKCALSI